MGATASQIISLTIVFSTLYSDADKRKHQSSASLAFVGPVNSPRKWPLTRKMLPFDDVIMDRKQYIESVCLKFIETEQRTPDGTRQPRPTCRLFGSKPLAEPMLAYCQLDPQTSVKFWSKSNIFTQQNAFENVVCEMMRVILSRPQCVNVEYCSIFEFIKGRNWGCLLRAFQINWLERTFNITTDVKIYYLESWKQQPRKQR